MVRPDPVCVYCRRRPVDPAWRPFCSERCKAIDLGDWANERYRVPAEDQTPPEGEEKEEKGSE